MPAPRFTTLYTTAGLFTTTIVRCTILCIIRRRIIAKRLKRKSPEEMN
jgi:hypothetical protein